MLNKLGVAIAALSLSMHAVGTEVNADEERLKRTFVQDVSPLIERYCADCHGADDPQSGIRLDNLDGTIPDRKIRLWESVRGQIEKRHMPPKEATQPNTAERKQVLDWIDAGLHHSRSRERPRNGSIRRLTVTQYRHTLRELLGIRDDLTAVLPPDAVSKDGFRNNQETLLLSPLLLEAYFEIAQEALNRCIVDVDSPPTIQSFRMLLGEGVNDAPCPDKLILGANSHLLKNDDFQVVELQPKKPFDYRPLVMRRKFRFHEGYQGNSTVRGWREYDSIYHAVFACMRGTGGYPKGEPYEVVPTGLLLRPAIPSPELFGQSSTYGPQANFKISLRELPDRGEFRIRVKASKYDDAMLLDPDAAPLDAKLNPAPPQAIIAQSGDEIEIAAEGVYQLDIHFAESGKDAPKEKAELPWGKRRVNKGAVSVQLGERRFSGQLQRKNRQGPQGDPEFRDAFLAVRLPKGNLSLHGKAGADNQLRRFVLHPLSDDTPVYKSFVQFEKRTPNLGVHLGLRRDCGSTLAQVGSAVAVGPVTREYVFRGAIDNYPRPFVEDDNTNYLAGVREIGVRCEYTDGRDTPRLQIHSIEFEGPFYESWPPASHRRIFSNERDDSKLKHEQHARQIIGDFATRAYRRPATSDEIQKLLSVWREAFDATNGTPGDFRNSVKDALLVVLTSPQFLFLIETSQTPAAEPLSSHELASKLSYFLWNAPPDKRLLELAQSGELQESLDQEMDRLIDDQRFGQFADDFVSQWMNLEKFDVVEVDRKRYPALTRDTRRQLRLEPIRFVQYLIQKNLPLRSLIESDIVVANDVVAAYYELEDREETGFEFAPLRHERSDLGGLLTQASILSGLSDGRESNPVKRGAWFARKIISKPPSDPPPNVPQLEEGADEGLTLREKLFRHRDQEGCRSCHAGIDPWGIPFEQYDAGGRYKTKTVDASSTLPDASEVKDLQALKAYLLEKQQEQVAFSVLKHLATYGCGRTLNYREIELLREKSLELKPTGYPLRELIRTIIHHDIFLTK